MNREELERRAEEYTNASPCFVAMHGQVVLAYFAGATWAWSEAVRQAAEVLDEWGQGVLEQVNAGDATLTDVREDLRWLEKIKRDILALDPPAKDDKT